MDEEVKRLRELGVKITYITLKDIDYAGLSHEQSPVLINDINTETGNTYRQSITNAFITRFRERTQIVRRVLSGKKLRSARYEELLDRRIAYYLGELQRRFLEGGLDEDTIENMDETHLFFDNDDLISYGRKGQEVKYLDVVSGSEGTTLALRLTGGRNAKLMNPYIIFKNADASYPIQGCADIIPNCS